MSGKLDQSLDEIMKDRKTTGGPRRGKGRLPARKAAIKSKIATTAAIAPAGGIQKNTKAAKATAVKANTATKPLTVDSKINVFNLPHDVTEPVIKDYFGKVAGPVKRVIVNYDSAGNSRGSATVIFAKAAAATQAAKLNGTAVDGKPMRIELVIGANSIPPPAAPKPLSERVAKPKNAAQEAQKKKKMVGAAATAAAPAKGRGKKAGNNVKSGRAGRPKAKTTEELDAEMQDYFGVGGEANGTTTNGTAQPAAATNGGDLGMEDEVM